METWFPVAYAACAGLLMGGVLGAVVRWSGYCAMGAVADIALMGDWRRMRAWLLALAVALGGTQVLALGGAFDLAATAYAAPPAGLPGAALGALLFGFGMTQTGGCISTSLVRVGGGSAQAVVVLAVVVAAAAATLAALAWLPDAAPAPTLAGGPLQIGLGLLVTGGVLLFCLQDRRFRTSPLCAAGLVLGALVPLGWLVTSRTGAAGEPAASLNFIGPAVLGAAPFWLGLVMGTLAGAFLAAWRADRFRLEPLAAAGGLGRSVAGALLMGVGGVLAGGCTVGQGLSGVSTLAPASWVALAAMLGGAFAGIRYLEQGTLKGALRALLAPGGTS